MQTELTKPAAGGQPSLTQSDLTDKQDNGLLAVASAAADAGLIARQEGDHIRTRYALGLIGADDLPIVLNAALAKGNAAELALDWLEPKFLSTDVVEVRVFGPPSPLC